MHREEQSVLQQTMNKTRPTIILLTPLAHPPSLQFTPLLTATTFVHAPLGLHCLGEMAVTVSLVLLGHQDLQGYLVLLGHLVWPQLTCATFRHLLLHPLHPSTLLVEERPTSLGEDLLPNSGWD